MTRRPRAVDAVTASLVVIVGVAAVGGVVAALAGGVFTDLGSGAGGLWGLPSLATTLLAFAALPLAVVFARQAKELPHRWRAAIVVAGGAWVVAIGYFVVAHAVDPCVNGWWDGRSSIGGQPLCERFGMEFNWHTRFHLLAHAAPAVPIVVIYVWAVRRWASNPPPVDTVDLEAARDDHSVSTLD